MKSSEKTLRALGTKSERVTAPQEHSPTEDNSVPIGQKKSAVGPVTSAIPEKAAEPEGAPTPAEFTKADRRRVDPHLVCLLDPRSKHAETYYRLRHKLETRRTTEDALVVAMTSAGTGDGKTLTAINLAGALARGADSRILLLDLNLRRTGDGIVNYLGMDASKDRGVVDWAEKKDADLNAFTHYLEPFNLHVLTAGSDPEHPYELLKSPRLDELLRRAREAFDFVIVDAPQILGLPDTELISRLVDGYVIVVKAGHTRQARLEEALSLMTEDQVLGLVFNAVAGTT